MSTDSEFVHLAWRQNHADLRDLPFPMLADIQDAIRIAPVAHAVAVTLEAEELTPAAA